MEKFTKATLSLLLYLIVLLTLSLSLKCRSTLAATGDTISANASLSGDETILSAGGFFRLGFYNPGNTSNFYIAIWYASITTRTAVWVANRDRPITDKSTSRLLIRDSNLVLLDGSDTQVWSTAVQTNASVGPLEAVLLSIGNLVLRPASDPSSTVVWQSIDHPTHTWLPGGKLGLNKRTGKSQLLTSWTNPEDPAPGLFSLELDPNGTSDYFILWNRTIQYWRSGTWDSARRIFSRVPEMTLNYQYDFEYVSNADENYFTYSVKDPTVLSRFIMDYSGQVRQETWLQNIGSWYLFWSQPRQQCEVYDYCGAFGACNQIALPLCNCLTGFQPRSDREWGLQQYSGGCVRQLPLQCRSNLTAEKEKDRFLLSPNMKLPASPQTVAADGGSVGCEMACLNNCACTAYAYDSSGSGNASGCSIWLGDLINLMQLSAGDSSGKDIYIRLNKAEFSDKKSSTGVIVGIVLGSSALLLTVLGAVIVLAVRHRRRRRRLAVMAKALKGSVVAFDYGDLRAATKSFSEKLGGGGFGSVFKGALPDSTAIAVKRLDSISQGEKQFRTEVSTIGTVQHLNLVRLRGFCSEGSKKLLVYDYMSNGSLDANLFHGKCLLDWKTRYQIVLGTARGLLYLHEKCRDCIIHCDVKPENILLDADFCPKVSDFGLAKLVGRDFSRVLTTMRGTRGYLAPEWISGVPVTAKADVYSYGMMLFEFISGRRNSDAVPQDDNKPYMFFPTCVATRLAKGDDLLGLLDHRLEGNAHPEELVRVCRLACWCIQDDELHRPSMGLVVQILEGLSEVNLPPIPRSLKLFLDNREHVVFFTESSSSESSQLRSDYSSQTRSITTTSPLEQPSSQTS